MRRLLVVTGLALLTVSTVQAQKSEPDNTYLFPAGGQRGTQFVATVEGENITGRADFHFRPTPGVSAPARTQDRRIRISLGPDTPLGLVPWRISTTNGGAGSRAFVVGDFPELIEEETGPLSNEPQPVKLPVTVNGRINPRADVDRFSFELRAGERFYAEVTAARLGGPIDTNVFTGQFGNPPDDVTYKQLDASLKVYGPAGTLIAQAEDTYGLDPALGFRAPAAGRYVAELHHLAHLGMPQFVYRLTLAPGTLVEAVYPAGGRRGTTAAVTVASPAHTPAGDVDGQMGDLSQQVRFDAPPGISTLNTRLTVADSRTNLVALRVGDFPELAESEPNGSPDQATPTTLPATLNGRFLTPGDMDYFLIRLRKGELWRFEALVEQLGSPTDAELALLEPGGKVLASNDDGPSGTHDPLFWYAAPADGEYLLQIRETGSSRLGDRLVYRIEAHPQPSDFALQAGPEAVDLSAGGTAEVAVSLRRMGGFDGPVEVVFEGLPVGVTAAALSLAPKQDKGKIKLTATAAAPAGSRPVRVLARASIDGRTVERSAEVTVANPARVAFGSAPQRTSDLLLTVRFPAPFRIEADDTYTFMSLGTVYPAKVKITRDPGFTAPITLSMADRQPRDPYGITFDPVTVSDLRGEVFIPMRLPQGPRGNPIVRCFVKAEAVVKDASGVERHVMQTSPKQVVLRTQAPVFSLEAEPAVVRTVPGTEVPLRFRLGRNAPVPGPAEIRLHLPNGMQGISMKPVAVAAGQSEVQGALVVGADAELGPDGRLWFEATTTRSDNGYQVFFRIPVELDLRRPRAAPTR